MTVGQACQEVLNIVEELVTDQPVNRPFEPAPTSRILRQIPHPNTLDKARQPGFSAWIRVAAQSADPDRRRLLARSLSAAFSELAGDNELEAVQGQPKVAGVQLRQRYAPLWTHDPTILCADELARLLQLPPASLQVEYPRIESSEHRAAGQLPAALTQHDGLVLGSVTRKGQTIDIRWPVGDFDELCLPRVVIGGMGSGKTVYAATLAIDAVNQGYSVFAVDVADGQLCDRIRDGVQDSERLRILDFGARGWPIGLDWQEATRSGAAANRLAAECASFFSRWVDETGGRTRRWLRAAAKAAYARPGCTLLDVVLMLISDAYRAEVMPRISDPLLAETWRGYHAMSPGSQSAIYGPVLSRLDYLLDDDALRNILCQPACREVDFRQWADSGCAVLLRVPKSVLGDSATDALVAFLLRKLWLAILTRQDVSPDRRRPCFVILDEPHQYMTGSEELWREMTVEARKWRLGLVWLFHSFAGQFPRQLRSTIEAAGPHYMLLATSRESYEELQAEISPWTVEEALQIPRYHALCRVRAGGQAVPAFLARLPVPASPVADRSLLEAAHRRRFGRPVAQVEAEILAREQVVYQSVMSGKAVRG